MTKFEEAIESWEAFEDGSKLFTDLKTAAVYETPIYLRYPFTEGGKTKEEVEAALTEPELYTAEKQCDTMTFDFMDAVMDEEEFDCSEDVRTAVGNGLIKNFVYKFEDDQTGKLYVEATRPLTGEEHEVLQDYLKEVHWNGIGDRSEDFNAFLGKDRTLDVFNMYNAEAGQERTTKFQLTQIPLEAYQSISQSGDQAFADAVAALSNMDKGMER